MDRRHDLPETTPLLSSTQRSDSLVELQGPDDPLNPINFPQWKKWLYASSLGAMTFAVTFSSAVFGACSADVARDFNVDPAVVTWATTLFVFGFATGPVIMGPASELYGRRPPLFLGYLCFVLFQIPVARAHDINTILIWRFLAGVAAAGSPAIVPGYLADFLNPVERGIAVAIFAATTLAGPSAGVITGSFLLESSLSWRWTVWVTMVFGVVFGIFGWLILPETYVPVLLKRRAMQLRLETKNWALHSKLDEQSIDARQFAVRYLSRPFMMLAQEPILALMTLYISFTFGMVYFLFTAYAFSFNRERGFSPVHGSLPHLAVVSGIMLGSFYVSHYTLTTYSRKLNRSGKLKPEDRLPPMIVGAAILPIGLFWFSWTSSPHVTPWPQIVSGLPIGAGIQIITLQSLAYLIDIYSIHAASAISGVMIVRSLLGGLFPILAGPLYVRLGVQWGTSIVGAVATAFFIVPVVLYRYGARIRSASKYSVGN